MNTNKLFMAFGACKESVKAVEYKKYTGVAAVKVLAVCPNKKELELLYGVALDKDPVYLDTTEVGPKDAKKTVDQCRIDFIVQTVADKCNGIDATMKVSFFVANYPRFNSEGTKIQVIDEYGRTCWVTIEQAKAKEIPMYKNGPANITKNYRPAMIGEEELTNFIKDYLCIPNVMKYVDETWVMNDNPKDSEARLDDVANYFKGNFKELKAIPTYLPNNVIKVLFGVKTTDENRQYQAVYTQKFLRNGVKDYSKLEADVEKRQNAGSYPNVEFTFKSLKEYVNTPTTFNDEPVADPFANTDPFGNANNQAVVEEIPTAPVADKVPSWFQD